MKPRNKRFITSLMAVFTIVLYVSFPVYATETLEIAASQPVQLTNASIPTVASTTETSFSVQEGIFYIRNSELGNYMQIDDNANSSSSGAPMELWSYNGGAEQRWQLISTGDGYYKIKSMASGMVLTVSSWDSSGVSIVQQADSNSQGQKWGFSLTPRGTYIIRPKSGESYSTDWCMSAGSGILIANGRNVEQIAYTDNNDYKDEWILEVPYTYESYVYTDWICPLAPYEIREAYANATAEIFKNFGIYLYVGGYVNPNDALDLDTEACWTDILDTRCQTSCGPDVNCSTLHHHGAGRINDLLMVNNRYTLRIVDYAMCFYYASKATHIGAYGLGDLGGYDTTISYLKSPDFERTIQHELTHNLGASHGECDKTTDPCILKNNMNTWCNICKDDILQHLYN